MSAWLVRRKHIDHMVNVMLFGPAEVAPAHWPLNIYHDADTLGRMLWIENQRSIEYRYSTRDHRGIMEEVEQYTHTWPGRRLTSVEAIKAINCYEYQSCDHPGWKHSAARRTCLHCRDLLIASLPGYDAALWML